MPHFSHISSTLFPELHQLEQLIAKYDANLRSEVLATITVDGLNLPIWSIELGSQAADAPTIGFFGGVHGMERIGSQILLALLEN